MVKRSSLPPGPIPEGQDVHKQSGRFAGKWGVVVAGTELGNLKGRVKNFAAVQGPLLEEGGPVDAPRGSGPTGGWIFIPTDINRRPSGEAIYRPGDILDRGGSFINRHRKRFANFPPAIIEGQASPAWNLLVSGGPFFLQQNFPYFIMAKKAHYRPRLGFFFAGTEFSKILPGKLADAAVRAWKETE